MSATPVEKLVDIERHRQEDTYSRPIQRASGLCFVHRIVVLWL